MASSQEIIFMTFGSLVTIAGIILLFYRKEGGKNQLKVFGQEFEISTPALAVVLIGCSIFILPLFLELKGYKPPASPEVAKPEPPQDTSDLGPGSSTEVGQTQAQSEEQMTARDHRLQYSINFPYGDKIEINDIVFKFLSSSVEERFGEEKISVTLNVQLINNRPRYDALFNKNSLRILIGSVPLAPEKSPAGLVDARSVEKGEYVFYIPRNAGALAIQAFSFRGSETAQIPIELKIVDAE